MKKISLLAILLATACANLFAQTFEGTIRFRTMENSSLTDDERMNKRINKIGIDAQIVNGARHITMIVKGDKVMYKDETTHMTYLYDSENNTMTMYSELTNKGVQFEYSYGLSLMLEQADIIKNADVYKVESQGVVSTYENKEVEYIKTYFETAITSTEADYYLIRGFNISPMLNSLMTSGLLEDIDDGILYKLVSKSASQSSLGNTMIYGYMEVTNIEERPVEDSELEIPSKVKMVKGLGMLSFYKDHKKYMEKHNMLSDQTTDVVYRIDEEWDF